MASSTSFTSSIPSGKAATIRIIDSTSRITDLPADVLMKPEMPGMKNMPDLPTWSFLVEHDSGRKLLFDLGVPVDWRDAAPSVANRLTTNGWGISVQKSTVDLLREGGIDANEIEAIVWSHWHWDHIGNPSHFPQTTTLIVGPGFTTDPDLYPGYPTNENPNTKTRDIDFANRELREISFSQDDPATLQLGPFRAHDYFGDGSFYILDTPGHATGHLAGLARTTSSSSSHTQPDTFIFMGGDLTHHAGELRPSPHLPLPSSIPPSHIPTLTQLLSSTRGSCPGSLLESLQESRDRKPQSTTPFFSPNMGKDIDEVIRTIEKTQEADADENVLYLFAHDYAARDIIKFFPGETANGWKSEGWREKLLWGFVADFKEALEGVMGSQGAEESKL